jgi:hypothetical protein
MDTNLDAGGFKITNLADPSSAHALCLELQTRLGVKLMAAASGDTVDGFMTTSGNGTVEVCLYEDRDMTHIRELPATKRTAVTAYRVTRKTDAELVAVVTACLKTERSFTDHPDMHGASVICCDM